MKIVYDPRFTKNFLNIWEYIAVDSKRKANRFKKELREHIEDLVCFPYKFRRSIYFEDEQIRDLIFKGYTIPYKIDKSNDRIVILGIKKYTEVLP